MYRSPNIVVYIVFCSSALLAFTGKSVQFAPSNIKLLYASVLWMSLLLMPVSLFKFNIFDNLTSMLFRCYALLVFGTVLNSAFFGYDAFVGNKWFTTFGNEECLLMLMTPFLAFLTTYDGILHTIKQVNVKYMYVCLILFAFLGISHPYLLWYICCFAPYYKKKYRILILLIFYIVIVSSFYAEETSRTMIFVLCISLLSYVLPYVLRNKGLIRIVCISLLVLPILYVLPILINPDKSIMIILKEIVMDQTGNEQLATDTRTFLFEEMSSDLTANDAWLFGKGIYSFYYSRWFDSGGVSAGNRLTSEVTLLLLLLRGGILLALSYYSILYYAVYKALKNGKNMFVLSAAIMISGWIFISSFSYVNGFKFYHLCFFILVGCCLSPKWLSLNDKDINQLLK